MARQLDHGFLAPVTPDIPFPIVEVRQYTVLPGTIGPFVELFEREFVESQEAAGMRIVGTFRVLDDPNRFLWIRAFANMDVRARSLDAFYSGPVWHAHRAAANAMLAENDNVLLLRPAGANSGFHLAGARRAPIGAESSAGGLIVAHIYSLGHRDGVEFSEYFESVIRPVLIDAGDTVLARLITERSPNNFPKLRLRDDANVFVWFSSFGSQAAFERYLTILRGDARWAAVRQRFAQLRMYAPPEVWRLSPTPRSLLRPSG